MIHFQTGLKKEQEEKEVKRRYEAQAHLHTIIKVARDEDLTEQIGRDIYFDLVDHDKVCSFCIQKQTPFNLFKEEVAKEFGIPVQFQRFWIFAERINHSYRPNRPLTPQEEIQSVGQLREVSKKTHNAELKLFLEVEFGLDLCPIPPPEKTKEHILLFFKLYEPEKRELRFVGRFLVKSSSKPADILAKLNQLAGFSPEEEIELYEEIKFEPCIMCEHLDKKTSFRLSQIGDGDIICFQKSTPLKSEEECKYPDVPSFLEYVHNFARSKLHTYDDVVERLAHQIGLEDPTKIRFTAHDCYSQQPKPQPIKFEGVEHLADMLVHYNQSSDILYYEVLDTLLPELQFLKNLKVAFHHATKDEVVIHNIRLAKQSTVGDVINVLKTKVKLSQLNAELRLLEVFYHKIYKILPHSEKIENINDQYWTLRAEEIPEEEKNLGLHDHLINVYHFTKDTAQNQTQVQNFGEPFFLVIHEGETLAEVKERIQKKLQVPDEEFAQWKFAFLSLGHPEYLQDPDVVSSRFQRRDVYGAWEEYLGLEHSDKALKSVYAVNRGFPNSVLTKGKEGNKEGQAPYPIPIPTLLIPATAETSHPQVQAMNAGKVDESPALNFFLPTSLGLAEPTPPEKAAQVTLESMVSCHETACREIEMQNDDLDDRASTAVDLTLRRLSVAEDLLKSTSAREPSAEALAALDTVSRCARSSLYTLCTNGAYEEFKAALKLLTEQGMIPSTITSMLKDILLSLEGEMPKYVAAEKELAQDGGEFAAQLKEIKAQMELAMQKCQERKDIMANYDAKVTKLMAELARAKAERAEAMANLEAAVDEMEPLKQNFADSSLKWENFIVRQATLTIRKCGPVGTWVVVQDVLKKYFNF